MENKKKKLLVFAISLAMLVVFGAGGVTADETVTVTWIVPGDTGFSIAWAGAESEIVFDASGQNFTSVAARSQATLTPIMNITNNGNTAVDYHMIFNLTFATGIDYVNCSVYDETNATLFYWTQANDTTANQTVASAIAVDGYADFWFFSDGTEVAETAEAENLIGLIITAVNV